MFLHELRPCCWRYVTTMNKLIFQRWQFFKHNFMHWKIDQGHKKRVRTTSFSFQCQNHLISFIFLFYIIAGFEVRITSSFPCRHGSIGPRARTNLLIGASLRSRRLEVVGTRKTGAREGDTRGERKLPHPLRVSLARARSLFRPLLPSACYAG